MSESGRVDVKQAVGSAKAFLAEVARDGGGVAELWVEEVARGEGVWLITLSHANPFTPGQRIVKEFVVDEATGEVTSMSYPRD